MDLPRMNFFLLRVEISRIFFSKRLQNILHFFPFFCKFKFRLCDEYKKEKKMPTRIVALHPFTTRSQTQLLPRRSRNSATPPQQPLHPLFFSLFLSPPSSFFFKKKTKNKKTFFYPSWVPPILSKLRECFFLLPS